MYVDGIENTFIKSLHRPFNTRLVTCKWTCRFARDYTGSDFKNDFFVHVVFFLYERYKYESNAILGLPKKETINILYQYIKDHENISVDLARFGDPSKKNISEIDKKLFSNLKAVSYYITLSKHLGFIGSKNMLTEDGLKFASLSGSTKHFMSLTKNDREFLMVKILENDLIPFLYTIGYYRLKKKYNPSDSEWKETDAVFMGLVDRSLGKREFKYKKGSLRNFFGVREKWIEDLELLTQAHNTLKPTYKKIIGSNATWHLEQQKVGGVMKDFEQDIFKTLDAYRTFKVDLYNTFMEIKLKNVFRNIGYVNLHDIRKELKLPFNKFEAMLNRVARDENNRKKVFFNNIIAAIDSRQRFKVKKTPVLNIRIVRKLT